jgi:hypothetical protein
MCDTHSERERRNLTCLSESWVNSPPASQLVIATGAPGPGLRTPKRAVRDFPVEVENLTAGVPGHLMAARNTGLRDGRGGHSVGLSKGTIKPVLDRARAKLAELASGTDLCWRAVLDRRGWAQLSHRCAGRSHPAVSCDHEYPLGSGAKAAGKHLCG